MELCMNIRIQYILILILALSSHLMSQKIEFQEYKLPTENNLQEVEFFNKYNGIIVTDSAEIFFTRNGGKEWTLSEFKLDFSPALLVFTPNGEAIVVGSKFTIIKSYDYGENWLIIKHDIESSISLNNVIFRSPYEIYITQHASNNLHYSSDGLNTINSVGLSSDRNNFDTYPMIFNKYDDNIYCIGYQSYDRDEGNARYYNEGIFRTKYFDIVSSTSFNTVIYPLVNENPPRSYTKGLGILDNSVIRFSGNSLFTLNGEDPYSGRSNSFYYLNNQANRIYVYDDKNVVIPCNNGELVLLNDFKFNDYYYVKASFDERRFKVTDTTLFDFYQVKSNKGIVSGMKGKYFIYDRSNTIDTLVIDTNIVDKIATKVSKVIVYPNPTSDYFTVEFLEKSNVESIQIYDVKGYRELNFVLNKELDKYKIDLRELQRGTYFIEIITSSGVFHKKIIKF